MKELKANSSSGRNVSIDFAKGIGMILVVYAHLVFFEPVLTIIYSFHMPLFFIISGILFNEKKYSSFSVLIKHKAKGLLLPFLVFVCVSFCLSFIMSLVTNGLSSELLIDYFLAFLKLLFANNSKPFSIIHNQPLWFLPCLFLVECIYYFLCKIKNKIVFWGAVATAYIVGWLLSNTAVRMFLPWNLCTALMTVSFYALGHCLFKRFFFNQSSEYFSKRITYIIISIMSFAICIPISLLNGKISLGHNVVNNGILLFFTGVLGSVSLLSLSVFIKKSPPLITYIGRNSFNIMGIHMLIVALLHFLLQKFFSIPNSTFEKNALLAVSFFLIILLISLLFVFLINKIKLVFQRNKKLIA